jgi:hypothetical protein
LPASRARRESWRSVAALKLECRVIGASMANTSLSAMSDHTDRKRWFTSCESWYHSTA